MVIELDFISLMVNCGTMIHLQDQPKSCLNGGKIKECIMPIRPIETRAIIPAIAEADQ